MNYDFPLRINNQDCQLTVTSVLGHLTQAEFAPAYKSWNSSDPVELFNAPVIVEVTKDMLDVAENLRQEARRADQVIIWTDCDREGEHIGQEIVNVCKGTNRNIQIKRARFSVISQRELMRAINNLHELDVRQADAVNARIELDLRIGAAFTRFQTLQFGSRFEEMDCKVISYGSCQFPTLGFVVDQYWKRERFVVDKFWYIDAVLQKSGNNAKFTWSKQRLFNYEAALVMYERCVDNPMATVLSVQKKPTSKWRPLPLTTVELQKFGSSVLKINSHRIMAIAEDLYNKGFISYPRTETDEFEKEFDLQDVIEKQTRDRRWGQYATQLQGQAFKWPRKGKNNDKAHPPIHPTKHNDQLVGDDARVYEFVTRRFLACCSDDAQGQLTTVQIQIAEQLFSASGLIVTARNYLEVYPYDKWIDSVMPEFMQGDKLQPVSCELHEGKTSPPNLLTESELIAIMDKNGIGTDATIAEHIKKIQDREYVVKEGQYFVPSTLGLGLVDGYDQIGFNQSLAKPALRAMMELRMKDIALAQRTRQQVIDESISLYRDMFVKADEQKPKIMEVLTKYFGHQPDPHPRPRPQQDQAVQAQRLAVPQQIQENLPNCECGIVAKLLTVTKESANKGRSFYGCSSRVCQFFEWHDNAVLPAQRSQTIPPVQWQTRNILEREATTKPLCKCNLHAKQQSVYKDGPNKGRKFWSCSKVSQPCGFFEWCSEENLQSKQNYQPGVKCFKCGEEGHYSSSCNKKDSKQTKRTVTAKRAPRAKKSKS